MKRILHALLAMSAVAALLSGRSVLGAPPAATLADVSAPPASPSGRTKPVPSDALPASTATATIPMANAEGPGRSACRSADGSPPALGSVLAHRSRLASALRQAGEDGCEIQISSPIAPAVPPDTGSIPRERPLQFAVTYRLDARAGTARLGPGVQLGGLEAEYVGSYGRKWEFAGQVPLGSQLASRGQEMHFGNLFFIRKWRLGAPTVKFGQFVVPFGNLTSYDVHSRLIQTLYRYSLGVRIDPGVQVEGYLPGSTEWQIAATSGNGPYRLTRDGSVLLTGRVSRKFERGGNNIRLGLSAAAGRLPVFSVRGEPVSAAGTPVLGSASKRRLALDAEVERGVDLFRIEGAAGTDGGRAARGLWAGWTRPLSANSALETAVETWRQPEREGRLWGAWLGGERRLGGTRTARLALRWSRSREDGRYRSELSLAAQYVRQF